VEFYLYVKKDGKVVVRRTFTGKKVQHGFAVSVNTIQSAGEQAVEEALDQAADFIESKAFSDALKGIASASDAGDEGGR
jgi:hypothetical protein